MSGEVVLPSDHEEREWFRLAALYEGVTARFIVEANQFLGQPHGTKLTEAVDHAVLTIGRDSAKAYHVEFRPTEFVDLADQAVSRIRALLINQQAQDAVARVIPGSVVGAARMERIFMPGLDAPGALRVEKFRQENPQDTSGAKRLLIDERNKRINLLSRTEVVRIGSDVLDLLWLENLEIEKAATRPLLTWDLAISGGVIPRYARKVWVTRKDGKVCQYCAPLDGITTGVGEYFTTIYGTFSGPPIHPQCRCVPALRSMRK